MKFKRTLTVVLSVLILVLPITGCDGQGADYILYIETDQEPKTVDPQLANGITEEMLVRNLFEGLMRYDKEGNLQKGVAGEVETSADGLSYTFTIREDAVWFDGTPLLADDFVFAAERALNPETKAPKANLLYDIKNAKEVHSGADLPLGISAISDRVLKIELSAQNPDFLKVLASAVFMPCQRKAFISFKGKYGMNDEDFLSNGSFSLKSWEKDGDFTLRINKNTEYVGTFEAGAKAVMFSVGEKSTRMEKLNKNNIDMGFVDYKEPGETIEVEQFSKTCYALCINPNSPFGVEEFKSAIRMSLDGEKFKSSLASNLEYAETLLPQVILKDNESLNSLITHKKSAVYDPVLARNTYLEGVKLHKDPGNITIIYFGDEGVKDVALFVAQSLQKTLGVIANIEGVSDLSELHSRMMSENYQLAIAPIMAQSSSVTQYLSYFSSENSNNYYGFSNYAFDAELSKTVEYMPKQELIRNADNMLNLIDSSQLITPLFYEREAFGYVNIYSVPKVSPFDGAIDFAFVEK